jgi:hypothetical protein
MGWTIAVLALLTGVLGNLGLRAGQQPTSTVTPLSPYRPSLGPLPLRNPLLWLAVAGLGYWMTIRSRRWPGPDRAVPAVRRAVCCDVKILSAVHLAGGAWGIGTAIAPNPSKPRRGCGV